MGDPTSRSQVLQDVKDAVRDLNDAIAVAAVLGIKVELEVIKHHSVGEGVPRPILEVHIPEQAAKAGCGPDEP